MNRAASLVPRRCVECEQVFRPHRSGQLVCCGDCKRDRAAKLQAARLAARDKRPIECSECHRLRPWSYYGTEGASVHMCRVCRQRASDREQRRKQGPALPPPYAKQPLACPLCGGKLVFGTVDGRAVEWCPQHGQRIIPQVRIV